MRPALAILVVAAILGVVQSFMLFQSSIPPPPPLDEIVREARGEFSLDITLTFDAEPDPFSLDPAAVLVEFRGEQLLHIEESVRAGTPLVISPVRQVVPGRNEFYVKAAAGDDRQMLVRGLRVRILRDGTVVAEQSLWSEPGTPVEGVLEVLVPAQQGPAEEQRGHTPSHG